MSLGFLVFCIKTRIVNHLTKLYYHSFIFFQSYVYHQKLAPSMHALMNHNIVWTGFLIFNFQEKHKLLWNKLHNIYPSLGGPCGSLNMFPWFRIGSKMNKHRKFSLYSNSCNVLHFKKLLETCLHVVFVDDTLIDATPLYI
jgi:hypothetical protein